VDSDRQAGEPFEDQDYEIWWVPIYVYVPDAKPVCGLLGPFDDERQARELTRDAERGVLHLGDP
jgi:hypothetical protein